MAIYDAYADAIFRHCYFRLFRRERAQELMQEAFTKTWECISRGDKIINIKAFVYKIANNLVIDEIRKKSEMSLDAMHEQKGFDPTGVTVVKQENWVDAQLLFRVIEKIDPVYREAVLMRYVDGLTPREIATITGETTNVISVRIHRGIAMLKKIVHLV